MAVPSMVKGNAKDERHTYAGFFGAQCFGILCIDAWAAVTGVILFWTIKKTVGIRVDKRIEEEGLDIYEHGESCYN